jgi:hypothetical protein
LRPAAAHCAICRAPYFLRPMLAAMARARFSLSPRAFNLSTSRANLPPPPGFKLLPLYEPYAMNITP